MFVPAISQSRGMEQVYGIDGGVLPSKVEII